MQLIVEIDVIVFSHPAASAKANVVPADPTEFRVKTGHTRPLECCLSAAVHHVCAHAHAVCESTTTWSARARCVGFDSVNVIVAKDDGDIVNRAVGQGPVHEQIALLGLR